jgi:hypothetical protein
VDDTPNLNPYASPTPEAGVIVSRRQVSVVRGLAYAVSWAAAVLALSFAIVTCNNAAARAFPPDAFEMDTLMSAGDWLPPAGGVALLFALAAFVNYTPARRIGLVRALVIVGSVMIVVGFFASFTASILGLNYRSIAPDDPRRRAVGLIAISIPVLFAVVFTARLVTRPGKFPAQ